MACVPGNGFADDPEVVADLSATTDPVKQLVTVFDNGDLLIKADREFFTVTPDGTISPWGSVMTGGSSQDGTHNAAWTGSSVLIGWGTTIREMVADGTWTTWASLPSGDSAMTPIGEIEVAADGKVWATSGGFNMFYRFATDGTFEREYNNAGIGSDNGVFSIAFGDGLVVLGRWDGIFTANVADEFFDPTTVSPTYGYTLPVTQIAEHQTTDPGHDANTMGVVVRDSIVYYSHDWHGEHDIYSVPIGGGAVTTERFGDLTTGYQVFWDLTSVGDYIYSGSPYDYKLYRWDFTNCDCVPGPDFSATEVFYDFDVDPAQSDSPDPWWFALPYSSVEHPDGGILAVTDTGIIHVGENKSAYRWAEWQPGNVEGEQALPYFSPPAGLHAGVLVLDSPGQETWIVGADADGGQQEVLNANYSDQQYFIARHEATGDIWSTNRGKEITRATDNGQVIGTIYNANDNGDAIPYGLRGLTFVGDLLYVASNDGVYVADINDAYVDPTWGDILPFTTLYYSALIDGLAIIVVDNVIYYTTTSNIIYSLPTSGGTPTVVYTGSAEFFVQSLIATDDYLYATSQADDTIYRWPIIECCFPGWWVGFIGFGSCGGT